MDKTYPSFASFIGEKHNKIWNQVQAIMRTSKQPSNKKKEKRTIAIDWQEKEMIECRKNWLILYQRRRKHGCNAEPGLEESFFLLLYFIQFFIVWCKVVN